MYTHVLAHTCAHVHKTQRSTEVGMAQTGQTQGSRAEMLPLFIL